MKRNWIIIGTIVVVLVVIATVIGVRQVNANAATTASERTQTATVTRGNMIATVTAAGNVAAPVNTALGFQTTGTVATVNVQVGDAVKKGQLLMQLDPTDLNLTLKKAQADLANAQANFDSTKTSLQAALQTAQDNAANAQSNLETAQAKSAQNPNQLLAAKAAVDKAQVALKQAQSAYDAIAWRSDASLTTQAVTLKSAQADYNAALANYQIAASNVANDTSVQQAQGQLDLAQVALEQAQKNIDTSTRTAQGQVDAAQIAVQQAQRNLDKGSIYAPYDGIVAQVNLAPNDAVITGTAVSLVDVSQLQVKVTIAEVDVAKIKVGQVAAMMVDALPGKTYNAKVLVIDPVGTVTQGVVNYPVTVAIVNNDGQVKPGMTANLAINVEERDNVLMVPLRAVRTQGNQKTVTALYRGQNISVPVTTGLTNDTSVEITSGLKEGDQIVLNQTSTQQNNNRGGLGIPGAGAIFRGN